METDFKIHGLDNVLEKIRSLPVKLQKKAMKTAGRKAMQVVRDEARRAASALDDPNTPSNIAQKIVTRNDARRGRVEGGIVTKVGVQGGADRKYADTRKNRGNKRAGKTYHVEAADTFHWRFLEFGTEKMAARPFMRPALENNIEQVTSVYVTTLNAEIDKALR